MRAVVALSLVTLHFCVAQVAAQVNPTPGPQPLFEVASVKPSPRPEPNPFGFPVNPIFRIEAGGRVRTTQTTLKDLIRNAYDLLDLLIVGASDWMTTTRFDVAARPADGFTGDVAAVRRMMRTLLADRFKLRAHTETRDLPVFHLVLARSDGKLGPGLRPSSSDCAAIRARRPPGATVPADGSEPSCRVSFDVAAGSMTITFVGETTREMARGLLPERSRPVVDKTGLAGTFDGELTFAPEPLPGFPRLLGSENGTSVYTALPEQMGLKLEPARGPVEVLVIDHAELPTEN
jgi:uncharacterized protein (TIGR03435 family)